MLVHTHFLQRQNYNLMISVLQVTVTNLLSLSTELFVLPEDNNTYMFSNLSCTEGLIHKGVELGAVYEVMNSVNNK